MHESKTACLIALADNATIALRGRIVTIGASGDSHIRLRDPDAPGRAGHLLYQEGGYRFQAFSAKTASVNGVHSDAIRALRHGDVIAIGKERFRYRDGPDESPSAPSGLGRHAEVARLIGCVVNLLRNREGDVSTELVASVSQLLRCDAARLVVEEKDGGNRRTIAQYPVQYGVERFSKRAIDWARDKAATVIMNEYDWEDDDANDNSLIKNSIASVLCGALIHDNGAVGYLYLDRLKTSPPFTEEDSTFCDTLLPLFSEILTAYRQRQRQLETIARLQAAGAGRKGGIIYESENMAKVMAYASRVAATDVPILLGGETGTGKELMARFIHENSPRVAGHFNAINSGAIPENLIESELFGHEKGAFTGATTRKVGFFEASEGGTLFLDEIGELPLSMQAKLLRVLQESEIVRVGGTQTVHVNVRIIAATNRDLDRESAEGRFRQDLFFRLNVLSITLPPLRERGVDITLLADYFVTRYCQQFGLNPKRLASAAHKRLLMRRWPGNIRELENVMQKAIIRCADSIISEEDIEPEYPRAGTRSSFDEAVTLKGARNAAERAVIDKALRSLRGNVSQSSELLEIDRKWLIKKMKELGINPNTYRPA